MGGASFNWATVTGLAGQTITYKLLVDDEPTFALPPVPVSTNSHTIPGLLPGVMVYWRVLRFTDGVPDPFLPTQSSFTVNIVYADLRHNAKTHRQRHH